MLWQQVYRTTGRLVTKLNCRNYIIFAHVWVFKHLTARRQDERRVRTSCKQPGLIWSAPVACARWGRSRRPPDRAPHHPYLWQQQSPWKRRKLQCQSGGGSCPSPPRSSLKWNSEQVLMEKTIPACAHEYTWLSDRDTHASLSLGYTHKSPLGLRTLRVDYQTAT